MVESFAEAISGPEDSINLAEAALWIARDAYPDLPIARHLARLDRMAAEIAPWMQTKGQRKWQETKDKAHHLHEYLFGTLRFQGNLEDYHDPRNSYLNEVLERRTGLPITLSVVYLEIGWRLGLPLAGIGMPGHFIVAWMEPGEPLFVDPFDRGRILDLQDCRRKLSQIYGQEVQIRPHWMEPVSKRLILTRMLNNLKGSYLGMNLLDQTIPVVEKLIILHPDDAEEIRTLGLLHAQAGHYWAALTQLERYLSIRPEAEDAEQVRDLTETLFERLGEG